VKVQVPDVLFVTLKLFVPLTRAVLTGRTAFESEDVIATVSFELIRFQFASTALTVMLKPVPAVWVVAVPILPMALPGAAVSPGARTWSLANGPAFTAMDELVLAVLVGSVRSEAVMV